MTLLVHVWSFTPAFCQIWIEPDHQVNGPNGPDGEPNTPHDDNPLNGTFKTQFEPWIAAHPWQLGVVFGAWNDYSRTEEFRSDGLGTSNPNVSDPPPWTHDLVVDIERPPPPAQQWRQNQADPGCAIGRNGMFYQCGVDWIQGIALRVYFARALTGSGTQGWDVGFISGAGDESLDIPKVTVDSDPQRMNRVYLLWAPGDGVNFTIMFGRDASSGDGWIFGGAPAHDLSDPNVPTAIKKGPVGGVGPGGEFYVAWFQRNQPPGGGGPRIMFNGTNDPFPASEPLVFFGPTTIVSGFDSIENGLTRSRTNLDGLVTYPGIGVDVSGCLFQGRIYVVYAEEDGNNLTPNFVKVLVGQPQPSGPPTWSGPYRVNWDAPGHSLQWHPAIVVDGKGRIGVMWYDTRLGDSQNLDRQRYDVFFSYSVDGGVTWSKNHRVTQESSDPATGDTRRIKIGEYAGIAAQGDSFYLMWMDLSRWNHAFAVQAGDIFATRIDVTAWPDFDDDCDVDAVGDYAFFQSCFSGSGNPFPPGCGNADFDADGDVDLADFSIFQLYLSGSDSCTCAGRAGQESFTDDGGLTWYTRTVLRTRLRDHCTANNILFR